MSTVIAWSGTYLVHSTILIVAAALASRAIRSAAVRDVIWKIALVGGIATTSLQTAMPERALPQIERRESFSISTAAIERAFVPSAHLQSDVPGSPAAAVRPPLRAQLWPLLPAALALLWLAAFTVLTIRLIAGAYRFRRLIADREVVSESDDRRLLDELRAATGCHRRVRLTASDAIHSPVAMTGSEIVVPKSVFARLTAGQRRSILAHELAHLARRDPAWLAATELLKALFFFQPLNRLAQRGLKQTAEFVCDDAAVAQTGDRRALAETLAELASVMTTPVPSNVAAMAEGGSNLVVRVRRVLQSARPDRPMNLTTRLAAAAGTIALTAIFAPGVTANLSARAAGPQPPSAETSAAATSATDAAVTVVAPRTTKRGSSAFDVRVKEMALSQSFDGPDGETDVRLDARDAELKADGSHIRFTTPRGYLRGTERSQHGPLREIEVRPGADREPVREYRVNGTARVWDADADRVIHAAFVKEKAYDRGSPAAPARLSRATPSALERKLRTWSAIHELTINTDGRASIVFIESNGVRYDETTGEVRFSGDAAVHVSEKSDDGTRRFTRNARGTLYEGRFHEPAEEWLARILSKTTKLPRAVIESIAQ